MRNKAWFNIFFMFISTVLFTGILSGVYVYTRPLIQANDKATEIKAHLNALNVAIPVVSDASALESFYNQKVTEKEINGVKLFEYKNDANETIYMFPFEGSGLWGKITGVVALDEEIKKVVGMDFVSQNETPGLGGRIVEDWFREQFRGITLFDSDTPIRYAAPGTDGQVDAITGATQTSTAVSGMINVSINRAKDTIGGGN